MDSIFAGIFYKGLENGDTKLLSNIKSNEKNKARNWNGLHYACQYRNIPGIAAILKNLRGYDALLETDYFGQRPCDLLPLPEITFFNLYSWGVGADYQLGYPKDKQLFPKKIDIKPLNYPAE